MKTRTPDTVLVTMESMERKAANLIAKNKKSKSKKVVDAAAMLERIFSGIQTPSQKVA